MFNKNLDHVRKCIKKKRQHEPSADASQVECVVSLGDLYADVCYCGARAEWGVASQKGPAGCVEAIESGRVYCDKHLPETKG
jgi:hypothetical protein